MAMDYRNRAKSRRIQRNIISFFDLLKFRGINLNFSAKIVMFGTIISFISLFLPWIKGDDTQWSSFSLLTGGIGYIYVILLLILLFSLISINKKEKLKTHGNLHFNDSYLVLFFGFFIFVTSIISIIQVSSLNIISSGYIYGNGVLLSITSGVVIIIGGLFGIREKSKTKLQIFTPNIENDDIEEDFDNEKNMKLPF